MKYKDYIESYKWIQLSEETRMARRCCAECGMTRQWSRYFYGVDLDVHHLTYERLGNELPEDLVVLCARCHALRHGKKPPTPFTVREFTKDFRSFADKFRFPRLTRSGSRQICCHCGKECGPRVRHIDEFKDNWFCEDCRTPA